MIAGDCLDVDADRDDEDQAAAPKRL